MILHSLASLSSWGGLEGPWKGREWMKVGRRVAQENTADHDRCVRTDPQKPPQEFSPTVKAHKEG